MTVSWNIDPGAYFAAITKQRVDAIEADAVQLINDLTEQAETWMKENARWNDVTGDARQALYADIEHMVRQSVTLLMSHGPAIDYAWALEGNPRTTLLGDAVDHWQPVVFRGVQEIVRRHSG